MRQWNVSILKAEMFQFDELLLVKCNIFTNQISQCTFALIVHFWCSAKFWVPTKWQASIGVNGCVGLAQKKKYVRLWQLADVFIQSFSINDPYTGHRL